MEKHIRLFNPDEPNTGKSIFDEVSGLLYWDQQEPAFYEVYSELRGNFWIPNEISLKTDQIDWASKLTEDEKELYKRAVSQLVLLDSVASTFDGALAAYIKNPAIKSIMAYIASQETIHNESYTYIATSFMNRNEAEDVFNRPKTDELVLASTNRILDTFTEFLEDSNPTTALKSLVAMACLEGVRFTNGFTPFYLLNRGNKMMGTGNIIQLIQRDEIQHSYFQTLVARLIASEIPEVSQSDEMTTWIHDFFQEVVGGEKALAEDMYKNFPTINVEEVKGYIEWRANILLQNLGLERIFEQKVNPMRWINAYDPENSNNTKKDFFERRETNYTKTTEELNDWDDL